jgi:hypothetical protein
MAQSGRHGRESSDCQLPSQSNSSANKRRCSVLHSLFMLHSLATRCALSLSLTYLSPRLFASTGQLKDLGNSLLGKFGLSLDNFKVDQNGGEGGNSYSVKFGQ